VVYLPLWKIWKSVRMIIPNIWKNKIFQTTNQHGILHLLSGAHIPKYHLHWQLCPRTSSFVAPPLGAVWRSHTAALPRCCGGPILKLKGSASWSVFFPNLWMIRQWLALKKAESHLSNQSVTGDLGWYGPPERLIVPAQVFNQEYLFLLEIPINTNPKNHFSRVPPWHCTVVPPNVVVHHCNVGYLQL
jgi:hypothetical protein